MSVKFWGYVLSISVTNKLSNLRTSGVSSKVINSTWPVIIEESFIGLTVNSKEISSLSPPSSMTNNKIVVDPLKFKTGCIVSWSAMIDTIILSGSKLSALYVGIFSSPSPVPVSISIDETVIVNGTSSSVTWEGTLSKIGASFIG